MKKLVFVLCVLVISVAVVFAQGSKESSADKVRVGIANCSVDEFFVSVDIALKEAAKSKGYEVVASYSADYDVQKQLEQVTTLKTLGVDLIVGSIVDTNNAEAIFEAASGVPQIWVSRHPELKVLEKYDYVWFVGSAEKDAGLLQGKFLADYFKDSGKTTLYYVLFMGPLGFENVNMRTAGVKEALTAAGYTIKATLEDTANWERTVAMSKMDQIISSGKSFDCVICNNDEMALGAIEAMKAAGKLKGIPVVGVDATAAGTTSVKNGEMTMTVLQNGKGMAIAAFDNAVKILAGEGSSIPKETWIPFEAVTIENVDNYM